MFKCPNDNILLSKLPTPKHLDPLQLYSSGYCKNCGQTFLIINETDNLPTIEYDD